MILTKLKSNSLRTIYHSIYKTESKTGISISPIISRCLTSECKQFNSAQLNTSLNNRISSHNFHSSSRINASVIDVESTSTSAPPSSSSSDSSIPIVRVTQQNVQQLFSQPIPILLICVLPNNPACDQLIQRISTLLTELNYNPESDFILATLDCETEIELVQVMRLPIQKIPTLLGIKNAQFTGQLVGLPGTPEQIKQLKEMMANTLGKPSGNTNNMSNNNNKGQSVKIDEKTDLSTVNVEQLLGLAEQALTTNNIQAASKYYSTVIDNKYQNPQYKPYKARATAGLINCLIQHAKSTPNAEEAKQIIGSAQNLVTSLKNEAKTDKVVAEQLKDSLVTKTIIEVELQETMHKLKPNTIEQLRKTIEEKSLSNEARSEAIHDLSLRLFAAGNVDEAMKFGLQLVRVDKKMGKELLLKYFETLGPTHPLTISGRKRMASFMF